MIRYIAAALFFSGLMAGAANAEGTGASATESSAKQEKAPKAEKPGKEVKAQVSPKDAKTKGKEMYAVFNTSLGSFKAKLFKDKAPNSVDNFVGLAEGTKEWTDPKTNKKEKKPLYDGTVFHRVIDGFMIQGGDPLGTGTGGPGFRNNTERHPDLKHSKPGILAMANAGPNTDGCQFYVTVAATPWLDSPAPPGGYSIFGEVVEGMDVVNKISKVKTAPGDRPVEEVKIKSVKIERK